MTLANKITLIRAFFAAMVYIALEFGPASLFWRCFAFGIFLAAALTDWLDGKIARQTGTVTQFGMVVDPFVDKLLVIGSFVAFVWYVN